MSREALPAGIAELPDELALMVAAGSADPGFASISFLAASGHLLRAQSLKGLGLLRVFGFWHKGPVLPDYPGLL